MRSSLLVVVLNHWLLPNCHLHPRNGAQKRFFVLPWTSLTHMDVKHPFTSFHILSLAINHNKRFCNGQSWAVRTVCTLARRALRAEVLRVFWSHFCMHGVTGMTKPGDQQIAIFRSLDKMGYPCENGTENGKWPVSFHCGSFVNLTPPVTAFKLAFAKHPSWVTL